MARTKLSNSYTHYESMTLEIQLQNVVACLAKQEPGSANERYLVAERDILLAKLEEVQDV